MPTTTKNLPRGRGAGRVAAHSPPGADVAPAQKKPDTTKYAGRLAERIREFREASKMTVEKVAEEMNKRGYEISAPTLYHWENGQREPQLNALPTLAKVLKVPLLDLLPPK